MRALTESFSSIRLLLTNTLVPRDTKSLVAGVSAKRLAEPQVVDPILDAVQGISDEARGLLSGASSIERQHLVQRLEVRSSSHMLKHPADPSGVDQSESRTSRHFGCFPSKLGDDCRCYGPRAFQPGHETHWSGGRRLCSDSNPRQSVQSVVPSQS